MNDYELQLKCLIHAIIGQEGKYRRGLVKEWFSQHTVDRAKLSVWFKRDKDMDKHRLTFDFGERLIVFEGYEDITCDHIGKKKLPTRQTYEMVRRTIERIYCTNGSSVIADQDRIYKMHKELENA